MDRDSQSLSFVADPLECLHAVWEHYDKKADFDMIKADWPPNYVDLLGKVDSSLIQIWPIEDFREKDGQLAAIHVRIRPAGLSLLQRPREVHRQVTIDGKKVDLRNERTHIILTPPIENLIIMASIWMRQLETEQEPGPRRAIQCTLARLLAYRGHELPLSLKDQLVTTLMTHTKLVNGYSTQKTVEEAESVGV